MKQNAENSKQCKFILNIILKRKKSCKLYPVNMNKK